MAKKKKAAEAESTDTSVETTAVLETPASEVEKPKAKRGRPAGSSKKAATKASKPAKKAKGKRGRPKGSKNKTKSIKVSGGDGTGGNAIKRGRGRPPGSGKKTAIASPNGLRGIITQIVREEVHAALLQAFKDM